MVVIGRNHPFIGNIHPDGQYLKVNKNWWSYLLIYRTTFLTVINSVLVGFGMQNLIFRETTYHDIYNFKRDKSSIL